MQKNEYLESKDVEAFIHWLVEKVDEDQFNHKYIQKRPKGNLWTCNSVFNAFENYKWSFKCTFPNGEVFSGSSYKESEAVLNRISIGIRKSLNESNTELFKAYCISILHWGGVLRSNREKINEMENSIEYFQNACLLLNPDVVSLNNNFDNILMNSGFTKIYSLLIDNFAIYDGRVGAALGLLVRKYLEESNSNDIPESLKFAYGNPKVSYSDKEELLKRNPSNGKYKFPLLTNNGKLHTKNNIKANWLINEVASRTKFASCQNPMRALESALFMIGYDIRQ